MKLRCPYCKATFGPEPQSHCPSCGKVMRIPGKLRPKRVKNTLSSNHVSRRAATDTTPMAVLGGKPATLIMIMLVFVFVGAMLIGRAGDATKKKSAPMTREVHAKRDLSILMIALEKFRADCDRYPTTEEGLLALINNPGESTWSGPYVTLIRSDPWHTRYLYEATTNGITLRSAGPDKLHGTPDDLSPSTTK